GTCPRRRKFCGGKGGTDPGTLVTMPLHRKTAPHGERTETALKSGCDKNRDIDTGLTVNGSRSGITAVASGGFQDRRRWDTQFLGVAPYTAARRCARPIRKCQMTRAAQRALWPSRSKRGLISTRSKLDTAGCRPATRAQARRSSPIKPTGLGGPEQGDDVTRK